MHSITKKNNYIIMLYNYDVIIQTDAIIQIVSKNQGLQDNFVLHCA